jgi:hypothetical protein
MKNTEITHIWASRNKVSGKNGNIRFDDTGIYSYNQLIASFRNINNSTVVFVNRYAPSNTTTNHISKVLSSISHFTYFTYNDIPNYASDIEYIHVSPNSVNPQQIWNQYQSIYLSILESCNNKKYARTLANRLEIAQFYAGRATQLSELFGLSQQTLTVSINADIQSSIDDNNKRLEQSKINAFNHDKQAIELWLTNDSNHYPNSSNYPIQLRLEPSNSNNVQTSRGAIVPLNVCKRLYNAYLSQCMPDDTKVGHFQLNEVTPNHIKIGCHTIISDELHRFAKLINLA